MSLDFLDEVERQLVAATERGVTRRSWRWARLARLRLPWRAPTIGIAAGIGAALAASAIAATLTLPASPHRTTTAVAPSPSRWLSASVLSVPAQGSFTTAGSVPRDFQPQSFTAIGEFTWWMSGVAPCGNRACLAIIRTTDGGRSFTRTPAPPTHNFSGIRFSNANDGYAFGPELWSTHDGGMSWTRVSVPGTVLELAASGPYVFAIVSVGMHGRDELFRSPVGSDDWTAMSLSSGPIYAGLWVQGNEVMLVSEAHGAAHFLMSYDDGTSFTASAPLPPSVARCNSPEVTWVACGSGMASGLWHSADGGLSFETGGVGSPVLPNSMVFGAASDEVAVAGATQLYRTADGGRTYQSLHVPSADAWQYIGFTDPTHGVALGEFGHGRRERTRLYYTIDAGASYHLVPIGS
jgi:photosystem II stability/assembly factor-like uncharacterized protein